MSDRDELDYLQKLGYAEVFVQRAKDSLAHEVARSIVDRYIDEGDPEYNCIRYICEVFVFSEQELYELTQGYKSEIESLRKVIAELQKKSEVEK
jgi:hypothetical protein